MTAQGDWQRDVFRDLGGGAPQESAASGRTGPGAQQPEQQAYQRQDQYAAQQYAYEQQAQQYAQQQQQHTQQRQQPQAQYPQTQQYAQQPPQQYAFEQQQAQRAPAPDPGPPPTPVSVPVVAPELARAQGRARRGDSMPRRTGRVLRRLVGSAAHDTVAETESARAIQQPITTGRQIAVTSIRGGSGKSTTAALLALGFAHYRADPVLAVEADPSLGTLPRRLGATEVRWSCGDLVRIMHPSMRITDLTGYLLPFSGGGWLLPASQGAVGTQLDVEVYRSVMTFVRRYFGVTIVDCETLPAEVARTALTTTQARVLVAPATVEGVAATRSVLDWIGGLHRSMLPTTVVVLSHTSPDASLDTRKAAAHLSVGGATVVELPYDRHLAAGGAVSTGLLGQGARAAVSRLAAAVMDRAVSRERRERAPGSGGGSGTHRQPQQQPASESAQARRPEQPQGQQQPPYDQQFAPQQPYDQQPYTQQSYTQQSYTQQPYDQPYAGTQSAGQQSTAQQYGRQQYEQQQYEQQQYEQRSYAQQQFVRQQYEQQQYQQQAQQPHRPERTEGRP